jgi:peptide/nickel transport system permease protein
MAATALAQEDPIPVITPWRAARRRMLRHQGFLIGLGVIVAIVFMALLAPWLSAHDPYAQDLGQRLVPPVWDARGSWAHVLGTDHLGRDYLARLMHGARISLSIGLGAASIGCLIGVTLGVAAGYFGGRVDQGVSYLLTCQLALPTLLLAMALVFLIGPSVPVVILVIGVLHWTYFLVVTRAATMQIRGLDYVTAARAVGCSRFQIIAHEVLPNLLNQIIVVFTLEIGIAIIAEASLSFLGVGVPAPHPSWGLLIAEGKNSMFFRPWLVVVPGLFLFTLVIAINLMGDGLRDVTAPENRN